MHATIAGVALGLVMARKPAGTRHARARTVVERRDPAAVRVLGGAGRDPAGVALGSCVRRSGASWSHCRSASSSASRLGGWLGSFTRPKAERPRIPLFGLVTIGALGGIGFTVSLLMNELAFAGNELVRREGTLAVLLGSAVSIVLAGLMVTALARRYRRAHPHPHPDGHGRGRENEPGSTGQPEQARLQPDAHADGLTQPNGGAASATPERRPTRR